MAMPAVTLEASQLYTEKGDPNYWLWMAFRRASPHSPVLCLPASLLSLPLALRGRPRAASRGLALGPGAREETVCTVRFGEHVRCTWFA